MATQPLFANAAGTGAVALTANYAACAYNGGHGAGIIRVSGPCDIIGRADIAVTAATRIEFQLQMSSLGDGDWFVLPFATDHGTYVEYTSKAIAIPGAIATNVPVFFHVPGGWPDDQAGGDIRILARRVDGGVGTTLFMDGEVRDVVNMPSLAGYIGAGASGAGATVVSAPFVSRAPLIVTGAYVYGNEFEAGDANYLSLIVAKTLAGNPTNVDFDIQSSVDAGATWRTLPQVNGIAAGVTTEQAMTLRTTEIGAAVGNYEYNAPILPGRRYRVGVAFTGGGTAPTLGINCQLFRI